MSRLIDADRLLRPQVMSKYYHLANGDIAIPVIDIKHAPPVDAVEVVRCKDCIHTHDHDCPITWDKTENDYCSYGERKDDELR